MSVYLGVTINSRMRFQVLLEAQPNLIELCQADEILHVVSRNAFSRFTIGEALVWDLKRMISLGY